MLFAKRKCARNYSRRRASVRSTNLLWRKRRRQKRKVRPLQSEMNQHVHMFDVCTPRNVMFHRFRPCALLKHSLAFKAT
jgi:hypothetical protein